MGQAAPILNLSGEQRRELETICSSTGLPRRSVRQAHALLLAAEGLSNVAIARRLGVTPPTVSMWRSQFATDGVESVRRARPGRSGPTGPAPLLDELVGVAAVPAGGSAAPTGRTGHPRFADGDVRVVGLYLHPSQRAVAVGAGRPDGPGSRGFEHDQRCHRAQDFLLFLKRLELGVAAPEPVHLLLDRYSTQVDHFAVDRWLAHPRRRRLQLHLTSSPATWLDLVDRWLGAVAVPLDGRPGLPVAGALTHATGQWVSSRWVTSGAFRASGARTVAGSQR